MPETRRAYDRGFRAGAVRIVVEPGKPIAQVARDLGMHPGTLGNWVKAERGRGPSGPLEGGERAELVRLRKENAELRVERDVLKRSVVLWVKEATK
ncbi:MAG: transposase [bacterium]|nr:transposase [bacterium]